MTHQALPVSGYTQQSQSNVDVVNENKAIEEMALRQIDKIQAMMPDADPRWLAIGRTNLEQAWMAINRSVFKPARTKLPGDAP